MMVLLAETKATWDQFTTSRSPELREQLFQQGIVASPGGPDDLTRLLKSDMERYRKVIEQAKITVE